MNEDELINISALQHYAYCPRQCALIYNYELWQDDWNTAVGTMLHSKVDEPGKEKRKFIKSFRSLKVYSKRLNLAGVIDLTEYDSANKLYYPIEYKKGKPKEHKADEIQLCAYALCLEEILNIHIEYGYIWYFEIRQRVQISFTNELRKLTLYTINTVKNLLSSGDLPAAIYNKRCKNCSIHDLCTPAATAKDWSKAYIDAIYQPSQIIDEDDHIEELLNEES